MENGKAGKPETVRDVKWVSEIRAISISFISRKVCSSNRCKERPLAIQKAKRNATAIMV